jgi:hypothetical protein
MRYNRAIDRTLIDFDFDSVSRVLCTLLPSRVSVFAEVKSCGKDPVFLKDCGAALVPFDDDRVVCLCACVRMEVIGISMDLRGSHHGNGNVYDVAG